MGKKLFDANAKTHYKMYKSGKKWIVAGIVALTVSLSAFVRPQSTQAAAPTGNGNGNDGASQETPHETTAPVQNTQQNLHITTAETAATQNGTATGQTASGTPASSTAANTQTATVGETSTGAATTTTSTGMAASGVATTGTSTTNETAAPAASQAVTSAAEKATAATTTASQSTPATATSASTQGTSQTTTTPANAVNETVATTTQTPTKTPATKTQGATTQTSAKAATPTKSDDAQSKAATGTSKAAAESKDAQAETNDGKSADAKSDSAAKPSVTGEKLSAKVVTSVKAETKDSKADAATPEFMSEMLAGFVNPDGTSINEQANNTYTAQLPGSNGASVTIDGTPNPDGSFIYTTVVSGTTQYYLRSATGKQTKISAPTTVADGIIYQGQDNDVVLKLITTADGSQKLLSADNSLSSYNSMPTAVSPDTNYTNSTNLYYDSHDPEGFKVNVPLGTLPGQDSDHSYTSREAALKSIGTLLTDIAKVAKTIPDPHMTNTQDTSNPHWDITGVATDGSNTFTLSYDYTNSTDHSATLLTIPVTVQENGFTVEYVDDTPNAQTSNSAFSNSDTAHQDLENQTTYYFANNRSVASTTSNDLTARILKVTPDDTTDATALDGLYQSAEDNGNPDLSINIAQSVPNYTYNGTTNPSDPIYGNQLIYLNPDSNIYHTSILNGTGTNDTSYNSAIHEYKVHYKYVPTIIPTNPSGASNSNPSKQDNSTTPQDKSNTNNAQPSRRHGRREFRYWLDATQGPDQQDVVGNSAAGANNSAAGANQAGQNAAQTNPTDQSEQQTNNAPSGQNQQANSQEQAGPNESGQQANSQTQPGQSEPGQSKPGQQGMAGQSFGGNQSGAASNGTYGYHPNSSFARGAGVGFGGNGLSLGTAGTTNSFGIGNGSATNSLVGAGNLAGNRGGVTTIGAGGKGGIRTNAFPQTGDQNEFGLSVMGAVMIGLTAMMAGVKVLERKRV